MYVQVLALSLRLLAPQIQHTAPAHLQQHTAGSSKQTSRSVPPAIEFPWRLFAPYTKNKWPRYEIAGVYVESSDCEEALETAPADSFCEKAPDST